MDPAAQPASLQSVNLALEQQLLARSAELQAANRELEAFAYSVSHDLRAPLRTIDGFARVLEEDYAARVDDEGKDALRRVRAAAQKMAEQIDDLLKLSRVARAELAPDTVDLAALARTIAAELRAAAPGRDVTFVIPPRLDACGDRALLTLVLRNLLGNAWKFTSRHATARIELGVADNAGEPAYFVRDDGAGFDTDGAKDLFAPFRRLHGESEFPGTGIGLAIVRRAIQRHGGRTWAEAAVEKGAAFHFTLPASA